MKKILFLFLLFLAFIIGSFINTSSKNLFTVKIVRISGEQKTDVEKENISHNKIKIPSKSDIYQK